jgi:hypothetical protein
MLCIQPINQKQQSAVTRWQSQLRQSIPSLAVTTDRCFRKSELASFLVGYYSGKFKTKCELRKVSFGQTPENKFSG